MKTEDVQRLDHGLYIVHWKDGGTSEASVGGLPNGDRWLAPTNWVGGMGEGGREIWRKVERMERVLTSHAAAEAARRAAVYATKGKAEPGMCIFFNCGYPTRGCPDCRPGGHAWALGEAVARDQEELAEKGSKT